MVSRARALVRTAAVGVSSAIVWAGLFAAQAQASSPVDCSPFSAIWVNGSGAFTDTSHWSDNLDYLSSGVVGCDAPSNLAVCGAFGSGTRQFSGNQTQAADVDSAFTFDLSGGNYTIAPTNGNANDYPLIGAHRDGRRTLTTPSVSFGGSLLILNNATVHVTGQIPASAATSSIVTTFDPGVTTSVSVTSGGTLTVDTQVVNPIPSFTLDSGSATFGQGASFQQATISNSTFNAGAVNGGAVTFGVDPNFGTPLSGAASTITGGTLALNGLTVEPTTSLTISGASGELDAVTAYGALDVTGHSNLTVSKVSGSATPAVGPQGLLTVENGSKLTESGGRVGVNGALKILSGGALTDDGASVAAALNGPAASATVDGSGSLWTVNGALNIGSGIPSTQVALPGSVTVEAGGALKVTGAIDIGVGAYSQGTLTINGAGSKLTANLSQVVIGGAGSGTLRLQDGASLDFSSVPAVQLGTSPAGSGTIVVDSGSAGPSAKLNSLLSISGRRGKANSTSRTTGEPS